MNDNKRYFWLKLEKDFFKRHDIRIIESMPNGKEYILFYLKLLCESTSHEGSLRFNDAIPYDINMLSTITNTNIDVVRASIKIFTELNMMSVLDDGTFYLSQVAKMIGTETKSAIRKREYRKKDKIKREGDNVPLMSHECPTDIDIEKDKEKDIELDLEQDELF